MRGSRRLGGKLPGRRGLTGVDGGNAMGRRRAIGAMRGAGGRRILCPHPASAVEYQVRDLQPARRRCRRCGTELLPLDPPPPRRRDKPWKLTP